MVTCSLRVKKKTRFKARIVFSFLGRWEYMYILIFILTLQAKKTWKTLSIGTFARWHHHPFPTVLQEFQGSRSRFILLFFFLIMLWSHLIPFRWLPAARVKHASEIARCKLAAPRSWHTQAGVAALFDRRNHAFFFFCFCSQSWLLDLDHGSCQRAAANNIIFIHGKGKARLPCMCNVLLCWPPLCFLTMLTVVAPAQQRRS